MLLFGAAVAAVVVPAVSAASIVVVAAAAVVTAAIAIPVSTHPFPPFPPTLGGRLLRPVGGLHPRWRHPRGPPPSLHPVRRP